MLFDLLKKNKCVPLRRFLMKAGRTFKRGLRGAILLGNANNADNAGSLYLNGNNAVDTTNANQGAFLNKT